MFNSKRNAVRTSAICGPASIVIECAGGSGVETPGAPASTYTRSQELEVAYQQTAGAIAGLYEFALQEETEAPEVSENGQAPELELVEA